MEAMGHILSGLPADVMPARFVAFVGAIAQSIVNIVRAFAERRLAMDSDAVNRTGQLVDQLSAVIDTAKLPPGVPNHPILSILVEVPHCL